MFYVYILQSKKNKRLYIGYTSDLRKRLEEHNKGESTYTKRYRPWRLIYYEAFLSKRDALTREKQLKRFKQTFALLKRRIQYSLSVEQTEKGGGWKGLA